MEGGTKRVYTTTQVYNQQQAIQGGGNFAVSGTVNTGGGNIHFESLDPLAIDAMERVATEAVLASGRYVEFASESNVRGLEANAAVAGMAIGVGMTPEQILANRGGSDPESSKKIDPNYLLIGGVVGVGLLIYAARKML